MIIKKVDNINDALECNKLLTKLVNSEKRYDLNVKNNYTVKEYFENIYSNENNCLFIAKEDDNIIYNVENSKLVKIIAPEGTIVEIRDNENI